MSDHSEKREGRTIHESGRAGDVLWKAVIEYDGASTYTISRLEVDGVPGEHPVDNATHQSLDDARVEIRQAVTGAQPTPGPES